MSAARGSRSGGRSRPITSSASAATLPLMRGHGLGPRHALAPRRRAVTSSCSRSPGTTCRRNLALSTPRSQARRDVPRRAVHQQDGRDLRQGLDHQHARHHRRAGKMPLKEIFVDGDVLDRHDPAAGLMLGDGVDQRRGIAIAEPVDGGRNVDAGTRRNLPVGMKSGDVENWRLADFQIPPISKLQLFLRAAARGVETLDDLVGDVQARVHVGGAGVGDAEHGVEAFLLGDLLDDRKSLLLEIALQLVLQLGISAWAFSA